MDNQAEQEKEEQVFSASNTTDLLKEIEKTTREYLLDQAEELLDKWWDQEKGSLLARLNEGISIELNSAPNMHGVQVHVIFKGWK